MIVVRFEVRCLHDNALLEAGALSGAPEWTIYEVASAESPAM